MTRFLVGLAALLCLGLGPAPGFAQTAAVVNPPVVVGQCPTFTDIYGTMVSSGVGCSGGEVILNDGVHAGTMRLVPTVFGLANSPGILNGSSGNPILLSKSVPTTGADGPDFDVRRNANYAGGTFGFVNTPMRFLTTVSAGTKSFEWGLLSIMDNSAALGDNAQNVAGYFQAHKRNGGGTWALVAELQDHNADPVSPSVTFEYDLQSKGTDVHAARVIQDLWGKTDDGNPTTISFAQRFNTDASTTLTNGLTTDGATISNAALAIGSGQKLCVDGTTCANRISQTGGTITITAGGTAAASFNGFGENVLSLNATAGPVSVTSGQKVILDGVTGANYLTQSGGTLSLVAGGVTGMTVSSIGSNVIALNSSGQITLPTSAKLCLDATTCSNYLTQASNVLNLFAGGTSAMQVSSIGTNVVALNSGGQLTLPTSSKLCLDATTCGNYFSQASGVINAFVAGGGSPSLAINSVGIQTAGISAVSLTASGTVQGAAVVSTGNASVPTNGKVCFDGSGCANYALYDGTTLSFYRSGTVKFSVNMSTGATIAWGGFQNGFSGGVTCSGAPTAAFAASGGIVTHC